MPEHELILYSYLVVFVLVYSGRLPMARSDAFSVTTKSGRRSVAFLTLSHSFAKPCSKSGKKWFWLCMVILEQQTGHSVSAYVGLISAEQTLEKTYRYGKTGFIPHARVANTCRKSADNLPCQSAQKHTLTGLFETQLLTGLRNYAIRRAIGEHSENSTWCGQVQWSYAFFLIRLLQHPT